MSTCIPGRVASDNATGPLFVPHQYDQESGNDGAFYIKEKRKQTLACCPSCLPEKNNESFNQQDAFLM
jgi:hypothetical protein